MNEDRQKLIMLSLFSMLLGSIFYIFGLSTHVKAVIVLNYILCLILNLASLLSVFRNRLKLNLLFYWLFIVNLFLIILYNYIFILNII